MTGPRPAPEAAIVHATCLDVGGSGILLLGVPGSGKSDLALRLIDQPGLGLSGIERRAVLVADDQVKISRDGAGLVASAPPVLAGKLEVRGLGIADLPHRAAVRLQLAVRLLPSAEIERLPGAAGRFECLGVGLPLVAIDPAAASAPARVRAALDWLSKP